MLGKMFWIKPAIKRLLSIVCMVALVVSTLMIGGGTATRADVAYNSCSDVKHLNNLASDGEYLIIVQGSAVSLFCYKMDTSTPLEFIELKHTGTEAGIDLNTSRYNAGEVWPRYGEDVLTRFQMIRFNPLTLEVDTTDLTKSTSTGRVYWSNDNGDEFSIEHMNFADAGDCKGDRLHPSTANIDLRDTPFTVITDQFKVQGWDQYGTTDYSDNNQVVNLTGGGYCGGNNTGGSKLRLSLLSAVSLTLNVHELDSTPITNPVTVTAVDSAMHESVLTKDEFGNFVANALPPDNYSIQISAPGYVSANFQTGLLAQGDHYSNKSLTLTKESSDTTITALTLDAGIGTIENLGTDGFEIHLDGTTPNVTMYASVPTMANVTVSGATYTQDGQSVYVSVPVTDGASFTIRVQAQDGTVQEYPFNVSVIPPPEVLVGLEAGLEGTSLGSFNFAPDQTDYNFSVTDSVYFYLKPSINSSVISPVVKINGKSVSSDITAVNLQDQTVNVIDVEVSAQNIQAKHYHLYVTKYSSAGAITGISYDSQPLHRVGSVFDFKVPQSATQAELTVTMPDLHSVISNVYGVYPGNLPSVTYSTYSNLITVPIVANEQYFSITVTDAVYQNHTYGVVIYKDIDGNVSDPVPISGQPLTDLNLDGVIDIRDVWLGIQQHTDGNGNGVFDPYDDVVEMLKQIPPREITVSQMHPV